MAANWNIFKSNLTLYFKLNKLLNRNVSSKDIARMIAINYGIAIRTATNQYGHLPTSINILPVQQGFEQFFNSMKRVKTANTINRQVGNFISKGIQLYWIQNIMLQVPPIPPSTIPISNNIIYTGDVNIINNVMNKIINNKASNVQIDNIVNQITNALRQHLGSIEGIYTGMVVTGGVNTPIQIKWRGLF